MSVDDNQDGSSAKSTELDNQPASVSESTTTDQNTAAPVITSSSGMTSDSAHSHVSATQAQVAQSALPSQGEFQVQTDVSGGGQHLDQGHANYRSNHPVDSHRYIIIVMKSLL